MPTPVCCIAWCHNSSRDTVTRQSLFFPLPRNLNLANAWREWIVKENLSVVKNLKHPFVCSEHFSKDRILTDKTLKPGTVPTIGRRDEAEGSTTAGSSDSAASGSEKSFNFDVTPPHCSTSSMGGLAVGTEMGMLSASEPSASTKLQQAIARVSPRKSSFKRPGVMEDVCKIVEKCDLGESNRRDSLEKQNVSLRAKLEHNKQALQSLFARATLLERAGITDVSAMLDSIAAKGEFLSSMLDLEENTEFWQLYHSLSVRRRVAAGFFLPTDDVADRHPLATPPETGATIEDMLPDKCLIEVFKWLTAGELVVYARGVCRRWLRASGRPSLWRGHEVCIEERLELPPQDLPLPAVSLTLAVLRTAPCLGKLSVKWGQNRSTARLSRLFAAAPLDIQAIEGSVNEESFAAMLELLSPRRDHLRSLKVHLWALLSEPLLNPDSFAADREKLAVSVARFWELVRGLRLESLCISPALMSCPLPPGSRPSLRSLDCRLEALPWGDSKCRALVPLLEAHAATLQAVRLPPVTFYITEKRAVFTALLRCSGLRAVSVPCGMRDARQLFAENKATLKELELQVSGSELKSEFQSMAVELQREDGLASRLVVLSFTSEDEKRRLAHVGTLLGAVPCLRRLRTLQLEGNFTLPTRAHFAKLAGLEVLRLRHYSVALLGDLHRRCVSAPRLRKVVGEFLYPEGTDAMVQCPLVVAARLRDALPRAEIVGFDCHGDCGAISDLESSTSEEASSGASSWPR